LTAPAEADRVPLRYFVEDVFLTVTFWPADVDTVKLDVDTLPTVPTVPPAAGPDLAPPPAGPDRGMEPTVVVVVAVLPAAEPLLAVALTMP
jgi:hypothetical protein